MVVCRAAAQPPTDKRYHFERGYYFERTEYPCRARIATVAAIKDSRFVLGECRKIRQYIELTDYGQNQRAPAYVP
jgi:hypothetical protein